MSVSSVVCLNFNAFHQILTRVFDHNFWIKLSITYNWTNTKQIMYNYVQETCSIYIFFLLVIFYAIGDRSKIVRYFWNDSRIVPHVIIKLFRLICIKNVDSVLPKNPIKILHGGGTKILWHNFESFGQSLGTIDTNIQIIIVYFHTCW